MYNKKVQELQEVQQILKQINPNFSCFLDIIIESDEFNYCTIQLFVYMIVGIPPFKYELKQIDKIIDTELHYKVLEDYKLLSNDTYNIHAKMTLDFILMYKNITKLEYRLINLNTLKEDEKP